MRSNGQQPQWRSNQRNQIKHSRPQSQSPVQAYCSQNQGQQYSAIRQNAALAQGAISAINQSVDLNQGMGADKNTVANQNTNKSSKNKKAGCNPCCQSAEGIRYVGNVFLLGLTTLVAELVDLQAAKTSEYLLQPFLPKEAEEAIEEEALAADISTIIAGDEIVSSFIPIGFE